MRCHASPRDPFEDPRYPNNLARTIGNVLAVRVRPFPDDVSVDCRRLILGLLRREPRQRTTLAVGGEGGRAECGEEVHTLGLLRRELRVDPCLRDQHGFVNLSPRAVTGAEGGPMAPGPTWLCKPAPTRCYRS